MDNTYDSNPAVTNCSFSDNSAASGGGMVNFESKPTVTNCTFTGNSATSDGGGGMANDSDSNPTVTNCTFSDNSAVRHGGGMRNNVRCNPAVTNSTFSGNSASISGGGMFNENNSDPALTNCVLWGNVDDADGNAGGPFMDQSAQIHTDSGTPVVIYSIVQGGWSGAGGNGVVDADPLFVDPDGPDDVYGTEDDDLRLMPGSPAIDAGRNAAVPPDVGDLDNDGDTAEPTPLDLDGNPRFVDDPNSPDCPHGGACGTAPIVDMGPYEFACESSGDFDSDADVDLRDFGRFQGCFGVADPLGCNPIATPDLDGDGQVDLDDYALFVTQLTGPGL
jgi:parallel beta-helix repeat protein